MMNLVYVVWSSWNDSPHQSMVSIHSCLDSATSEIASMEDVVLDEDDNGWTIGRGEYLVYYISAEPLR